MLINEIWSIFDCYIILNIMFVELVKMLEFVNCIIWEFNVEGDVIKLIYEFDR